MEQITDILPREVHFPPDIQTIIGRERENKKENKETKKIRQLHANKADVTWNNFCFDHFV